MRNNICFIFGKTVRRPITSSRFCVRPQGFATNYNVSHIVFCSYFSPSICGSLSILAIKLDKTGIICAGEVSDKGITSHPIAVVSFENHRVMYMEEFKLITFAFVQPLVSHAPLSRCLSKVILKCSFF